MSSDIVDVALEKIIPARKKIVRFRSIRPEFQRMGPRWRKARGAMSPADKCEWCDRPFDDGEWMGLGFRARERNMLLCGNCIAEAKGNQP